MLTRKTDWSLRNAVCEDRNHLADFIGGNAWQHEPNGRAIYEWKYEQNVAGDTLAIVAINSDQAIVASSMFMPWTLSLDGRDIPACQWVDLFVAPEYRGQSIAELSLEDGLRQRRQQGRAICFAFPNAYSVPIHKRANGHHLGLIVRCAKPLRSEYLIRRKVPSAALARVLATFVDAGLRLISKDTYQSAGRVREVTVCGPEFDEVWTRFQSSQRGMVMTRRDAAYLQWKFMQSPGKARRLYARYSGDRVDGWIVLEQTTDIGYIVDVVATSDAVLNELVAFALKTFRRARLQSAAFLALEHNPFFPALRRFGFLPRPEQKHLYVYLDDGLPDAEHFRGPEHWFVTIGDCDIDHM